MLTLLPDGKRKAVEQPDFSTPFKRIKNSHTISPEKEEETKPLTVIPFPEKVSEYLGA